MKLLVVDDNEDIRFLLNRALALDGHEIMEAAGGEEALRLITGGVRPDLVILDVQMPDLNGWEVLRRVRENPATADLRVLVCTVKGSPDSVALGWELGCDGYLEKPFDIAALAAEVTAVTERPPEVRAVVRERELARVRGRERIG